VSYKDKIIAFPLFNTCYPQNLARNLAKELAIRLFIKIEHHHHNYLLLYVLMD
jgi:hypothetical protein